MKIFRLAILFFAFAGAGCDFRSELTTPQIAEQIGRDAESLTVAQFGGFGEPLKAPAIKLNAGAQGKVMVTADFPNLPENITVIRVKNGRPNDTQIRNISDTLDMPAAIAGPNPEGRELTIEWKDDEGVVWKTNASERRIDFFNESKPIKTLTVSAWPENDTVVQKSMLFLQDHGLGIKKYGLPYVDPDWIAWWKAEKTKGRCMSAQTISSMRAISASLTWLENGLPTLPQTNNTACVSPEFPSRMVVRLDALQDGQKILNADGSPRFGATLLYDVALGDIVSGWITVPVDPDRSDYPALTIEQAKDSMSRGGLGGTPNGEVTIDEITFEWLSLNDGRALRTDYLYPILVGQGRIRLTDGKSAPYRIIVPLVK